MLETTNISNSASFTAIRATRTMIAIRPNAMSRAIARCNALGRRDSQLVVYVLGIVLGMISRGS